MSQLLEDNDSFLHYIYKGVVEIHWQKKKISHPQLINNLINSSYLEELNNAAKFLENWNEEAVK